MAKPTTEEEIVAFIQKVSQATQVDFESPDNPNSTYHDVVTVLGNVNEAMGTNIEMPNVVIVQGLSPETASYNDYSDTMIINERALSFQDEDEINAIIAHELGHKIRKDIEQDAAFDTAVHVMDTVNESCPADKAPGINSIIIKNGFTFTNTTEELQASLIKNGLDEQCAQDAVQALKEHSDALKSEELFSDMVAIKAGYGEGIIKTMEVGVMFYGHSINPDDLTAHPHPKERLEHAKQVMEKLEQQQQQQPANDAAGTPPAQQAESDDIDLSSFAPENGGAAAGNIDMVVESPNIPSTDTQKNDTPQTTIQNGL